MGWLEQLRRSKQMTEQDVAKAIGISQQHYNFIENGKRRPSVSVAKSLGALLGFDWTQFYDEKK